jgi:hypothetical protein
MKKCCCCLSLPKGVCLIGSLTFFFTVALFVVYLVSSFIRLLFLFFSFFLPFLKAGQAGERIRYLLI